MLHRLITPSIFLMLFLAVALFASGVSVYANSAPIRIGGFPDWSIRVPNYADFDLSSKFSDPDGDALTYTATANSSVYGTLTVTGSTLRVTAQRIGGVGATGTGDWQIFVSASDGSLSGGGESRILRVTVHKRGSTQHNIPNAAPQRVGTIPAQTVMMNEQITLDASSYFSEDDGDVMMYGASSDATSVATASVSGTTVTITPVAPGSATISVIADDGQATSATQTFTVTVTSAPVAVGTIPDQYMEVGGTAATVDVSSYFSDADGDPLAYTATSADTSKATVSVSSATVTITPVAVGTSAITVTARDGSSTATQTFSAVVDVPNTAPITVGSMPDQTMNVGESMITNVDSYFQDTTGHTWTYTAATSDTSIATASMSGIRLTVQAVSQGTATISVTMTDYGGLSATQTFSLTVPNRAPVVGTIPDVTIENGSTGEVSAPLHFTDPDGDTLTYAVGSSDPTIVSVSLGGTGYSTLSLSANALGTVTITVTATDTSAATVTQTFSVTVIQPNQAPTTVGTISNITMKLGSITKQVEASGYFNDADGDSLTYTASSSNEADVTVSVSNATVTITSVSEGWANVTVTASDGTDSATQTFKVTVSANSAPVIVISISTVNVPAAGGTVSHDVSSYFSDPDGDTLTYTATSSDTTKVTVSMSNSTMTITAGANVSETITLTVSDGGFTVTQSFTVAATGQTSSTIDALPRLSGDELSQLDILLTYDTLIFNELHNGSDDATDWLELRNVSAADIALDDWQLTIWTGEGHVVVPFPADTVIPTGAVLLLTNTEMPTADASVLSVVAETFALPQTDFALILRDPIAFGDITGNYVQGEGESPQTAPALTVDTTWERTQPVVFGYRAEAWTESTSQDGLGTPGYRHPDATADLNSDGVVNILDLVLVASHFGTTHTTADLNADGTVGMDDLVFVANAWGSVAGAPTAGTVNAWLQLARQNVSDVVATPTPEGFSYARGLQTLEQLAHALVPETTALLANYPNPFNPETWIPYQLSKAADVMIRIYAADGNVVRTLTLGHQDAGMYKNRTQAAYWDGKNELGETVASGLYFYTLTAGDFSATRRMLILK